MTAEVKLYKPERSGLQGWPQGALPLRRATVPLLRQELSVHAIYMRHRVRAATNMNENNGPLLVCSHQGKVYRF